MQRSRWSSSQQTPVSQRYQLCWNWGRLFKQRIIPISLIAATASFLEVAGQSDAQSWFPILFLVQVGAIFFLAWLIGELGVTLLVFVREWFSVIKASRFFW